MTGIGAARRWVALVVLGLGASLLGVVAPPPAAADGTLGIAWPDFVSAVNPDATDYTIGMSYDGTGSIWLSGGADVPQQLVGGANVVAFGADGYHVLRIWECDGGELNESCVERSSRGVTAYRRLHLSFDSQILGPAVRPDIGITPRVEDDSGTATWEVVPASAPEGPALLEGSGPFSGQAFPPIGPTDALTPGSTYVYRASITRDDPIYVHLEGEVEGSFKWERRTHTLTSSVDKFWPTRVDGPGQVRLRATPAPGTQLERGKIEIFAPSGLRVATLVSGDADISEGWAATWYGMDPYGDKGPLAPGIYRVEVTLTDDRGTVSALERDIEVGTIGVDTWRRTYRAARTVVGAKTGECAELDRPAREEWPGSLGYRSLYRGNCSHHVRTLHVIEVPRFVKERYRGVRVSFFGGPMVGTSSGSLGLAYDLGRGVWGEWVYYSALVDDLVRTDWVDGARAIRRVNQAHPFVHWKAGLRYGNTVDVKSFRIEVRYEVYE